MWPLVGARIAGWLEHVRALRPAPRAAVVEVPLLFEAGMEGGFDATIAVVAARTCAASEPGDAATRSPTSARRGSSPRRRRRGRATFVVRNDGTMGEMRRELAEILDKLGAMSIRANR